VGRGSLKELVTGFIKKKPEQGKKRRRLEKSLANKGTDLPACEQARDMIISEQQAGKGAEKIQGGRKQGSGSQDSQSTTRINSELKGVFNRVLGASIINPRMEEYK